MIEAVFAMGVILMSMVMLATTALVGFKGAAVARQRQAATALADQLVEQVRALPSSVIIAGLKDSEVTADTTIKSCSGGVYKLASCTTGEVIVHSPTVSLSPLSPHLGTVSTGYPTAYTWSAYLTNASGTSGVYRLTVTVAWIVAGQSENVQVQTLLAFPDGTNDPTTSSGTGGASSAYFYGTSAVSPGNVMITPNSTVYNSGIGVTGLGSSVWSSSSNLTQSMYALTAELAQGQLTKVNGQSTLTSAQLSGATAQGGATTFSIADDDATTTGVATTDAPTGLSQTGPSVTLSGGGNSLSMSQFTQTTTTTTTTNPGNVTKRSVSSNNSSNGTISISKPTGLAVDDLMILQLSYQGTCMSTPSGWNLVRCDTYTSSGNTLTSAIFYRFATSSDASSCCGSFSTGSTNATMGGIIAYSGADPAGGTPIDSSTWNSGTSTTASTGTLNITTSNTRLVSFFAGRLFTTVTPVDPGGNATNWAQNWSGTGGQSSGPNAAKAVGGASSSGDKSPPGANTAPAWSATLSASNMWVAQMIALKPANVSTTTTTTTTGSAGAETGATVSTTQALSSTPCGSPSQTNGKACAYANQSYAVPAGTDGAFLQSTVNLAGSGLGTCALYAFNPPTSSPTNYAYGQRAAGSGDGTLTEDVKRFYGTHTFGSLCGGTGSAPTNWPGYFVKYDAGNTASEAIAQSGVSAGSTTKNTAGTISVWNGGSGVTSFAVPASGTWSTAPTTVNFTTGTGYHYDISAQLASGASTTSVTSASGSTTEAKAVVGAPVIGTITYKLTNPSSQVLIDLTMTIDLGTLTSYAKYTPAA